MAETEKATTLHIEKSIGNILDVIDREREREIISRRYGLFDRKETLEQIGELLGITRERVRQLEKSVILRLKAAAEKDLQDIEDISDVFKQEIVKLGGVARISDLTATLVENPTKLDQSRVSFLAQLVPSLAFVDESDHYHMTTGLVSLHTEKAIRDQVGYVIEAIKKIFQLVY
jgi:hypothetical protein